MRFQRTDSTAIVALAACFLWGAGCGGRADPYLADRPAVVPAEGIVTYNGNPLDGATVVFSPVEGSEHGAAAITAADGTFELSTFPPDPGAVPGKYQIAVTKMSVSTPAVRPEEAHDADFPTESPKALIPDRYSDPVRSGLTAEVPPEGSTELKIELNDQG